MPSITFWTRLEPQAREATMARGLQAQVRDALWMLARQWQLGEFRADDAGSPIQATFRVESLNLTGYQPDAGEIVPLDTGLPLETHIEREAVTLGLRGAAQLGVRFEAFMQEAGLADLVPRFREAYPIASTPPAAELPDVASQQFRMVVAGRVTDGNALYTATKAALASNPPTSPVPVPPDKEQGVQKVLQDFADFRESLYSEPTHDAAWKQERLEYQFAVGAQSADEDIALASPEFRGGHLDWYSFALSPTAVDAGNPTQVQVQDRAIIPTHVSFRGMPNNRWWNFEDGSVDLGQLDTEQVDLAKMLVMEFALVYGNDWFEVPIQLPVGSLSKVTLLVVTDTFGVRTLIRPTLEQSPPGEQPWSMFTISGGQKRSDHLFVPPTLDVDTTMDGPTLEDVLFLRDEMAAMGWAIEEALQGPLDTPVNGYESYFKRLVDNPLPGPPGATPGGPSIYYLLGTTDAPPDNWLPLVPIVTPEKALYFRRGTIDRPGIPRPTARAQVLNPGHPFFVTDQTVPRAGAEVTRSFRRVRWSDGSTFVWMARKTRPGRGPGWSGLAFDLIKPISPTGVVLEPIWVPQNAGADVHVAYQGVAFVNPSFGWAVGVGGTIIATTDGQNWTIQRPSDQVGFLLDVSFVDELTGWAVGTGGLILATTDGGTTWQQQNASDPLPVDLSAVSFVDRNHGWVVGQHTVLATIDGGATWTPQLDSSNLGPLPADPLFSLHDVCFVDSNYGWAVGDEGVIIATTNGGASWTQQVSGISPQNFFNLFGVSFLDHNLGWAVGAGGTIDQPQGVILHTDTGGMNWIRKDVPAGTPTLHAVSATDSPSAWVVGDGDTILSTTDSGGTWKQDAILFPGNHIYDVSRYGWAVGSGGTILRVMYRE